MPGVVVFTDSDRGESEDEDEASTHSKCQCSGTWPDNTRPRAVKIGFNGGGGTHISVRFLLYFSVFLSNFELCMCKLPTRLTLLKTRG